MIYHIIILCTNIHGMHGIVRYCVILRNSLCKTFDHAEFRKLWWKKLTFKFSLPRA